MQLTTWTIYRGKELKNINREVIVKEEFPFLLLRPDLNHANEVLGLVITGEFVAAMVSDLLNRELNPQQVIDIFQDKMGTVEVQSLQDYQLGDQKISHQPILKQNIKTLMETYNILLKKQPVTFQSEDYDSLAKKAKIQDVFLELDFQNMPMHQLINGINSGMPDFYSRLNEIRQKDLDQKTRQEKMLQMVGLQTNLIFFFEQALKRMDEVIGQQQKEIQELKAQLPKTKDQEDE